MIFNRSIPYPVYTFVISRYGRKNVIQVSSNSKTNALSYFFQAVYPEGGINLSESSCFYFDKNGDLKEMDLQAAYSRRKNWEEL